MPTPEPEHDVPPKISIGMPIYNSEATIAAAIESILEQSFRDFELIISDNRSSDGTVAICTSYARMDDRIRFIQQAENIGSDKNFEFVFDQATGDYFMWAPAHYSRSANFLEANFKTLQDNPRCVFASSPNCIVGNEDNPKKILSFSLEGPLAERVSSFLDNCWDSHACFYSLFRRSALADFPNMSSVYLGNDWTLVLHLLCKGEFSRSKDSLLVVGTGTSRRRDFLARSRTSPVHNVFPLFEFSRRFIKRFGRCDELGWRERWRLYLKLLRLNLRVSWRQAEIELGRLFRTGTAKPGP